MLLIYHQLCYHTHLHFLLQILFYVFLNSSLNGQIMASDLQIIANTATNIVTHWMNTSRLFFFSDLIYVNYFKTVMLKLQRSFRKACKLFLLVYSTKINFLSYSFLSHVHLQTLHDKYSTKSLILILGLMLEFLFLLVSQFKYLQVLFDWSLSVHIFMLIKSYQYFLFIFWLF